MLPGEDDFTKQATERLSIARALGYALINQCKSIVSERTPRNLPVGEGEQVAYRVANALCIKATKTFRSVMALVEIGASHDADILNRTLYETAVATVFVVRPAVSLQLKDFADAQLTRELRAKIYIAYGPIKKLDEYERHANNPMFQSIIVEGPQMQKHRVAAATAESMVGAYWAKRIKKNRRGYSGFALKDLAGKLDQDFVRWYEAVYGEQSKATHAYDAVKHVQFDGDRMIPKWHTSIHDVQGAILFGGSLLVKCFDELHKAYDFSDNDRDKISTELELLAAFGVLASIQRDYCDGTPEASTS